MQLANRWLSIYSGPQAAVCPTVDTVPSYVDINSDLSVRSFLHSLDLVIACNPPAVVTHLPLHFEIAMSSVFLLKCLHVVLLS